MAKGPTVNRSCGCSIFVHNRFQDGGHRDPHTSPAACRQRTFTTRKNTGCDFTIYFPMPPSSAATEPPTRTRSPRFLPGCTPSSTTCMHGSPRSSTRTSTTASGFGNGPGLDGHPNRIVALAPVHARRASSLLRPLRNSCTLITSLLTTPSSGSATLASALVRSERSPTRCSAPCPSLRIWVRWHPRPCRSPTPTRQHLVVPRPLATRGRHSSRADQAGTLHSRPRCHASRPSRAAKRFECSPERYSLGTCSRSTASCTKCSSRPASTTTT
mmetsp:Transcript_63204/g.206270  ORF Transcript_63204/g.206270 Transcript_63204/m.206270 type:complete len:271 (+) Transcript_63204:331-1143(+)